MPGTNRLIGSSQRSLPSSTSSPTATAVKSFELEAMGCVVVGVYGQLLPEVAEAVPLGEDELVLHDDADADAGRVPVLHDLRHVVVEPFQPGVDVDLRGWDSAAARTGTAVSALAAARTSMAAAEAAADARGNDGHRHLHSGKRVQGQPPIRSWRRRPGRTGRPEPGASERGVIRRYSPSGRRRQQGRSPRERRGRAAPVYFRPSVFPAANRASDSRMRLSRVSARLAM